jgi:C2 domain
MKDASGMPHPFVVTIVVHSARNLAIADFTSSDPYVILLLDKKEIGRTPTVYRNLNPNWEVTFTVPLTHIHATVVFRIFDEDAGKNDDILGVVTIDLSTLYMNEILEKSYPVRQREDSNELAKGNLNFSVHIGKCEDLIRIQHNTNFNPDVYYETSAILKEEMEKCLKQSNANNASGVNSAPILMTLLKSPFLAASQDPIFRVVNKGLIRDLMCDVRSLLRCQNAIISNRIPQAPHNVMIPNSDPEMKDFITVADDLLPMTLLRTGRALRSSTRLDVETGEYSYHSPSSEANISLHFKDESVCTILFPDRKNYYLIWIWVKWLKLVVSIQKGEWKIVSPATDRKPAELELPNWAATGVLTSSVTVVMKSSSGAEVR